jgi:hypothetical protein
MTGLNLHTCTAICVFTSVLISGCAQRPPTTGDTAAKQASPAEPTIDQNNLCEVSVWRHDEVAQSCKRGQKVVFLPGSWGNEQLPVIFAAVNCDLRYSVAMTNGAVACIYDPITPQPAQSEGKAPAAAD